MDAVRKSDTDQISERDPYYSVPQAAREIGRAEATVRSLALKGELESGLVAGRTVITKKSVAEYKARNGIGVEPDAAARSIASTADAPDDGSRE